MLERRRRRSKKYTCPRATEQRQQLNHGGEYVTDPGHWGGDHDDSTSEPLRPKELAAASEEKNISIGSLFHCRSRRNITALPADALSPGAVLEHTSLNPKITA